MPEYEKEVGLSLGEALGGVETYSMSDLEGVGPEYPEGPGKYYRQSGTPASRLGAVEVLPEDNEEEGEVSTSEADDEIVDTTAYRIGNNGTSGDVESYESGAYEGAYDYSSDGSDISFRDSDPGDDYLSDWEDPEEPED